MKSISGVVNAAARTVTRLGAGVYKGATRFGGFSIRTVRAHHHVLGQYTVPDVDPQAPKVKTLNPAGQVALTIIPVIPLTHLSALTVTPLAVNGTPALASTLKKAAKLPFKHRKKSADNRPPTEATPLSESSARVELEAAEPVAKEKDHLSLVQQLYRLPGNAAGAGLGALVVFPAALSLRGLADTAAMSEISYDTVMHRVSPDHFSAAKDNYTALSHVLGAPGFLLGPAFAGTHLTARQVKPILSNSLTSMREEINSATNLVYTEKEVHLGTPDRSRTERYLLGMPGLVLGAPLAAAGFGFASCRRVGDENFESFMTAAERRLKTADDQPYEDNRHPFIIYGIGGPGYALGIAAGELKRAEIPENSLDSFFEAMRKGINPVLRNKSESNDDRSKKEKYVLGGPGYLVAAPCLGIFYGVWGLGNSIKSGVHLTGSLLNGGTNLRMFHGLAGDKRMTINKVLGAPGYAASAATVGPVAAGILFVNLSAHALLIVAAMALSPAVAASKGVGKIRGMKRFEQVDQFPIQNLYAMLDSLGDLPEGKSIPEHQMGNESLLDFIRHSLFLNQDSLTEEVLAAVLDAYKAAPDKEAFLATPLSRNSLLQEKLSAVKKNHRLESNNLLIDELASFVQAYWRGLYNKVPADLYKNEQTRWNTFFGRPKQRIAPRDFNQVAEEVAETQPAPL